MKPTILIIAFLLCALQICYAQYTITGRIADEHDSNVAFANVLLLDVRDSTMVKGAVADENGNYALTFNSVGDFIIQSYMVGFGKSYSDHIHLVGERTIQMPDIVLMEDLQQLEEVIVKAQKPLYEMEVGKMVVNVSSSITSSGQTIIDVLEKSPGMLVNRQNMTFSLNGKDGVIVLMNGKRNRLPMDAVYQLLEGLNSGDVEKIEIMSIPPSKYDADGDAGLINIVTKKSTGTGTSGSVMANVGYGSGPRAAGSINLSNNTDKIGIYGNYSFNHLESVQLVDFIRETSGNEQNLTSETNIERTTFRQTHNYQLGLDYYLGKRTVLGALVSGYDNLWKMTSEAISTYEYSLSPDTLILMPSYETNHWKHLMGNINLQHTFNKGQLLNINLDYLTYGNSNPTNYMSQYFIGSGDLVKETKSRIRKETPINIWVGKVDYSFNLNEKVRWDSGIKGTFSKLTNSILMEEFVDDQWQINDYYSNDSDLDENILAAFTTMNFTLSETTSINAGLRYEYTTTNLSTDEEENVVDRKYGNLFPTIYFSHKLKQDHLLQLSYGRRITRPTFNEMAPFVIFMDPYTFFGGNVNILPTYTDNIKADYSYKSLAISLQYSHDKDAILRFQPKVDPETALLVFVSDNIDKRETISTNITFPVQISEWWEMQNNVLGNWQKMQTKDGDLDVKQQIYNVQVNTTQIFKLPSKFTMELSALYSSPMNLGYFTQKSNGFVNFGIQKELSNEGVLRFVCNDIFETTQWRWDSNYSDAFSLYTRIKFDKRIFTLSYTQPIGNKKAKGARKRSVGSAEELRRVTN